MKRCRCVLSLYWTHSALFQKFFLTRPWILTQLLMGLNHYNSSHWSRDCNSCNGAISWFWLVHAMDLMWFLDLVNILHFQPGLSTSRLVFNKMLKGTIISRKSEDILLRKVYLSKVPAVLIHVKIRFIEFNIFICSLLFPFFIKISMHVWILRFISVLCPFCMFYISSV